MNSHRRIYSLYTICKESDLVFRSETRSFIHGEKIKEKDTFGLCCCHLIKLVLKTFVQTVTSTLESLLSD